MATVKDVRKAVNETLDELGDDSSDAQVNWGDLRSKVEGKLSKETGPVDAVAAFKAERRRVRGKNPLESK